MWCLLSSFGCTSHKFILDPKKIIVFFQAVIPQGCFRAEKLSSLGIILFFQKPHKPVESCTQRFLFLHRGRHNFCGVHLRRWVRESVRKIRKWILSDKHFLLLSWSSVGSHWKLYLMDCSTGRDFFEKTKLVCGCTLLESVFITYVNQWLWNITQLSNISGFILQFNLET